IHHWRAVHWDPSYRTWHLSVVHRHSGKRTWRQSAAHSHPRHRISVPPQLRRRNRGCENACYHATKEKEFSPVHCVTGVQDSNPQDPKVAALEKVTFSRSFSMARQFLTAKERNSAQRGANLTWPRHLASATVRKPV